MGKETMYYSMRGRKRNLLVSQTEGMLLEENEILTNLDDKLSREYVRRNLYNQMTSHGPTQPDLFGFLNEDDFDQRTYHVSNPALKREGEKLMKDIDYAEHVKENVINARKNMILRLQKAAEKHREIEKIKRNRGRAA